MENIPQISEMPSSASASPSIVDIGNLNSEKLSFSKVTLRVARSDQDIVEHFVVSFAKPGTLTCHDLLKLGSMNEILTKAEADGVRISEPALLVSAGNDLSSTKTLYLTPPPSANFRDFAVWVGHVNETVVKIKAARVAIYLCKESLPADDLVELMSQTVRALVESKAVSDISLVVGHHAYNEVLTTALSLKQELETLETSLQVLH